MCRRVVLVGLDVSEERIAYFFIVKTTINSSQRATVASYC
jgi:hypothetical protein